MSKDIDLEFYAKGSPDGERRLNIKRVHKNDDLEFTITGTREATVVLEEKEALEIASQIFRNVLGLY